MFQTFSGNSRRPRQVNLSGQNTDPFAANAWSSGGIQRTVANAQQERLQRQIERERLQAAKNIQRVWRGHKTRREVADERRAAWDHFEISIGGAQDSSTLLPDELRLLLSFFNVRQQGDIHRLAVFGDKVLRLSASTYFSKNDVQPRLPRLIEISLNALTKSAQDDWRESILRLLRELWSTNPSLISRYSSLYYKNLSRIVSKTAFSAPRRILLLDAIRRPLRSNNSEELNQDRLLDAYRSFGMWMLTAPNLDQLLGLQELAGIVQTTFLSAALLPALNSPSLPKPKYRLWILANFIAICRLQSDQQQGSDHFRLLSVLFSGLAYELIGRVDVDKSKTLQKSDNSSLEEDVDDGRHPLPPFAAEQIAFLAEKKSITTLFSRFQATFSAQKEDAALLARYALTLLQVFPQRGDEIRMWLHYSSMSVNNSELHAVKYFWQATKESNVFTAMSNNTESTLSILKSLRSDNSSKTVSDLGKEQEWQIIMLFLELYAFGLRFTDDEEFLAGGSTADPSLPMSRFGQSALTLPEVRSLTIFLKNLAFTLIYNANDLMEDQDVQGEDTLSTYLMANSNPSFPAPKRTSMDKKRGHNKGGINTFAGMTYSHVREVATGVLRALYERDSRRRFLPQGHWLMTSKFDMGNFIPAVVAEEERQHAIPDTGDPDDVDDNDEDDFPDNELIGMHRQTQAIHFERIRRQQRKAARKRALAVIGPRLEILQNMPFVIPFNTRVQIFAHFVLLDQTRRRGGFVDPDQWRMSVMHMQDSRENAREVIGKHHARIRRRNVFEDALDQFYSLGEGLKEPIQITFVDKFDAVEAGIDGGGVTKEFLTSITNEAFRTTDGQDRFVTNDQNLLYPNPAALDAHKNLLREAGIKETDPIWNETIHNVLREYEFLGRIVGKCLYEEILIDVSFAGFFLLKWAMSGNTTYRANINDLRDLDEDLYRGLLKLKNYPGDVENDFGLDFTIEDVISSPGASVVKTITRNLQPDGSNIPVTQENRIHYISLVTRHRLQVQPFPQTQAFLRGLGEIIKPTWLSMFNQTELQTLISGDSAELDIDDLRRNTQYGGVYQIGDDGQEHPSIRYFWQVMKELHDSDRRKVLKYVTSTPRAPLLGFAELNPKFSIRDAGSDEARLPSTSTCVNLLKLPIYSTKQILKEKLVYAVNAGAGFDLS